MNIYYCNKLLIMDIVSKVAPSFLDTLVFPLSRCLGGVITSFIDKIKLYSISIRKKSVSR